MVPELPEVTALAADLDRRLAGRVIDRLSIAAFVSVFPFYWMVRTALTPQY